MDTYKFCFLVTERLPERSQWLRWACEEPGPLNSYTAFPGILCTKCRNRSAHTRAHTYTWTRTLLQFRVAEGESVSLYVPRSQYRGYTDRIRTHICSLPLCKRLRNSDQRCRIALGNRNAAEKTQSSEDGWTTQPLVKRSVSNATNVYISNICPVWFLYYELELWAQSAQFTV